MNDLLQTRLEEVLELARKENDINTVRVLLALVGSRRVGLEGILADALNPIMEEVLYPMVLKMKGDLLAKLN